MSYKPIILTLDVTVLHSTTDTTASQPVKVLHAFVRQAEWGLHNGVAACRGIPTFTLLMMTDTMTIATRGP